MVGSGGKRTGCGHGVRDRTHLVRTLVQRVARVEELVDIPHLLRVIHDVRARVGYLVHMRALHETVCVEGLGTVAGRCERWPDSATRVDGWRA